MTEDQLKAENAQLRAEVDKLRQLLRIREEHLTMSITMLTKEIADLKKEQEQKQTPVAYDDDPYWVSIGEWPAVTRF